MRLLRSRPQAGARLLLSESHVSKVVAEFMSGE